MIKRCGDLPRQPASFYGQDRASCVDAEQMRHSTVLPRGGGMELKWQPRSHLHEADATACAMADEMRLLRGLGVVCNGARVCCMQHKPCTQVESPGLRKLAEACIVYGR